MFKQLFEGVAVGGRGWDIATKLEGEVGVGVGVGVAPVAPVATGYQKRSPLAVVVDVGKPGSCPVLRHTAVYE